MFSYQHQFSMEKIDIGKYRDLTACVFSHDIDNNQEGMCTNLVSIGGYHSFQLSLTTEGHGMGPGHYEAIITRTASKENHQRLAILTMAMCIACKESCVPQLGASRFCDWDSEFCS